MSLHLKLHINEKQNNMSDKGRYKGSRFGPSLSKSH